MFTPDQKSEIQTIVRQLLSSGIVDKKVSDIPTDYFDVAIKGYVDNAGAAASGIGSGTTTVQATFTPTKVPIVTKSFANGITFDSGNGRFKISSAGQYLLIGFAYFSNPSTADVSYQSMVYQNGSKVCASYSAPHATGVVVAVPAVIIVNCAVGDYIELYAQTGSSSTQPVSGSLSYLSIAKV
jgi:hypothetical protein